MKTHLRQVPGKGGGKKNAEQALIATIDERDTNEEQERKAAKKEGSNWEV